MTLRCKVWGHKVREHKVPRHGYHLNQPYFRRGNFRVTDGINRIHQSLTAECSRCDTTFEFGRIHDYPKPGETT